MKTGKNQLPRWLWVFVILLFLLLQASYLGKALWNDELYTLEHFVFVPAGNIVSDYHVPNNHVLFSLVLHGWCMLTGVRSIGDAIAHTALLRLLPLLISAASLLIFMRTARRFLDDRAAMLSTIILISTLPFLNFNLQLRGYGLATLLCTWILYHFLTYIGSGRRLSLLSIPLLSALAVYTIPLNVYFLLGLGTMSILILFIPLVADRFRKSVILLAALAAGGAIAALFYLPVFRDVFFNKTVDVHGIDLIYGLQSLLHVGKHLLGARYLLLAAAPAGLFLLLRGFRNSDGAMAILASLVVFLVPFIVGSLRGDHAPYRAFVNLAPVFALAAGALSWGAITRITWRRLRMVSLVIFYAGLVAGGVYTFAQARQATLEDIVQERRTQDIHRAYYLWFYHPEDVAEALESWSVPVVLFDAEPHGMRHFLNAGNIRWYPPDSIVSVSAHSASVFVVTRFPALTSETITMMYPDLVAEELDMPLAYHSILLVNRR